MNGYTLDSINIATQPGKLSVAGNPTILTLSTPTILTSEVVTFDLSTFGQSNPGVDAFEWTVNGTSLQSQCAADKTTNYAYLSFATTAGMVYTFNYNMYISTFYPGYSLRVGLFNGTIFTTYIDYPIIQSGNLSANVNLTSTASEEFVAWQVIGSGTALNFQMTLFKYTPSSNENLRFYANLVQTATPNSSSYLKFSIPQENYEYTFTYGTGADQFGGGVQNTYVMASIAKILEENAVISSLYTISTVTATQTIISSINIISKRSGSLYDLSNVITSNFLKPTFGSISTEDTNGLGNRMNNLYLYADISWARNKPLDSTKIPNAYEFYNSTLLRMPYNTSNEHTFDISEVLKPYLTTPKPHSVNNNIVSLLENISSASLHYKINVGYYYSTNTDVPQKHFRYALGPFRIFNASIPRGGVNVYEPYIANNHPVKFLTTRKSVVVKRDQYNLLYFYVTSKQNSLYLKYIIRFTDGSYTGTPGTYSTYQTAYTLINPSASLYYVMHKVSDLIKSAEESTGKTAYSYQLAIVKPSNIPMTEELIFRIDNKYYEFKYDLIYENSIGGYDSFQLVGEAQIKNQRSFTTYVNAGNYTTYQIGDKFNAIKEVTLTTRKNLASGWIKRNELEDIRDQLNKSPNVYQIENGKFKYVQILSVDDSIQDGDDLYNVNFEITDTIPQTNISA